MIFPWPTAAEERQALLQARLGTWRETGVIDDAQRSALEVRLQTRWRAQGLVLAAVFFVLGCAAIGAVWAFAQSFRINGAWTAAAISFIAAELLIRLYRFAWTGVEAALWLCAALFFIFGFESSGKPEALLVFAAAIAVAALRVRNPIFGGLAVSLVLVYFGARHWGVAAHIAGIAVGAASLIALFRVWRRISTELLFALMLVVVPPIGAACAAYADRTSPYWFVAYVLFAAVTIAFGILRRDRAALIAAFVLTVVGALVAQPLVSFVFEWQLIIGGALLIAIAALTARALRGHRAGLILGSERSAYEEALQIVGTLGLQPSHAAPQPSGLEPGGGQYGGAGATGEY